MAPSYLTQHLNEATGLAPSATATILAQNSLAQKQVLPQAKDPENSSFMKFSKDDLVAFQTTLNDLKTVGVGYELLNTSPRINNVVVSFSGEDHVKLHLAREASFQRDLDAHALNPVHFENTLNSLGAFGK